MEFSGQNSDSANITITSIHDSDHGNDSSDSTNPVIENTILAINFKSSRIGWSYFSCMDGKLYVVEDIPVNAALVEKYHSGWSIIENLLFQVKPTLVLIPARIEQGIEDVLRFNVHHGFRVDIRPSNEFAYGSAVNRIVALHKQQSKPTNNIVSPDEDISVISSSILLDLSSRINMEKEVSIGCAGCVLSYTQKLIALEDGLINQNDAHLQITNIETFRMSDIMFVNSDTLCSLQIFEDESHPNFQTQGMNQGHKEGLSLFGILNSTVTPFGHQLLKTWFLRPTLSVAEINCRLDAVTLFARQDNAHIVDSLRASLKKIKNIPKILVNLSAGKSTYSDYKAIMNFSFQCVKIKQALSEIPSTGNIRVINGILSTFESGGLTSVCARVGNTVDFEMSPIENRVVIKPTIDQSLDEMKRQYDGMSELLANVARSMSERLEVLVGIINVIYFPQLGYLAVVEFGLDDNEPIYSNVEWEFQFRTDTHGYYKTAEVKDLDNDFGDIYGMICDREVELEHELQIDLLRHDELLIASCTWTAELDCILSFSEAARTYNYKRPVVSTEKNLIKIHKGRHPLYELLVPSFVENDTFISGSNSDIDMTADDTNEDEPEDIPSTVILTGANFSGKSVYLKQVALIVYMTHIGSFVPAEFAKIGLTDKILTRVMTRETVSREQSAFMVDLTQVCLAMQLHTERSLIIVDEFGKGTEATDGAGLFAGLIEYLSCGTKRPKVLASTHYHELFENDILQPSKFIDLMHMQVLVDDDVADTEGRITYLYRLLPGRSTSSFGIFCAALNGISEDIIQRAEELSDLLAKGEDLVTLCAKVTEREIKAIEHAETVARRFLREEFAGITLGSKKLQNIRLVLKRILYGR
ncbi:muts domain V-domain-containing protein [Lipomyces japonicus]|uniref:muts domain V-domain-containing protein n=1 Tax=Lipomyces japonicus TaxID=56871 RepID=UPI0034CDFCF7